MKWPASIGIVLHDLPLGGTERIALRLARAWCALGIPVTIFCGDARGSLRGLVPEAARLIEATPPIPRANGSRQRLGEVAARHFAGDPVEMLFVTGNYHWELVPALARIPGPARPVILAQISSPIRKPQRGWLLQRLFDRRMRGLLGSADALIALDAHAARDADRVMGRSVAHVIATPALDDDSAPPCPAPEVPTLLAAGRLHRQKDFATLIKAFARLRSRDVRLVIAGEGEERPALLDLARRLGVSERIDLPGFVPDMRPLLDATRLFVLSSAYEGYPAVLVEALAAGRPVAATDCALAVDMLLAGQPWGRITPIGDAARLAYAIEELLASPAADPADIAATVEHHRLARSAMAYLDLAANLRERAAS